MLPTDTNWGPTARAQALTRLTNLTPRFGIGAPPAQLVPEAAFIPQHQEVIDARIQP